MTGDAPVDVSRDPAREAARRELSKAIYHQDDPSLLQRALNRLWDTVDTILSAASGATAGGWVGLVTIVTVVIASVVALRLRLGPPRRTTDSEPALFGHRPRTAAEHRAAAEQHAARGRWAEAVQERMRALVRSLEERAVLDPHPGRTADEAAVEAGHALPAHAPRLRDAARVFDDVTYGGRPGTEQAYAALRDLDEELPHVRPLLHQGPRA